MKLFPDKLGCDGEEEGRIDIQDVVVALFLVFGFILTIIVILGLSTLAWTGSAKASPSAYGPAHTPIVAPLVFPPAGLGVSYGAIPAPLTKRGQCPGNYAQSGSYCSPFGNAAVCVPKRGQCPGNYAQSGDYCCQTMRGGPRGY